MMSSEIQHLGNKLVEKSVQMLDRLLIRRQQLLEDSNDPNLIIGSSRPRLPAVLRNIFEGRRWPYDPKCLLDADQNQNRNKIAAN